jgi:hypothetical protein
MIKVVDTLWVNPNDIVFIQMIDDQSFKIHLNKIACEVTSITVKSDNSRETINNFIDRLNYAKNSRTYP